MSSWASAFHYTKHNADIGSFGSLWGEYGEVAVTHHLYASFPLWASTFGTGQNSQLRVVVAELASGLPQTSTVWTS